MSHVPQDLLLELHRHQQEHLIHFWDQLTPAQQEQLCQQIRLIDFDQIRRLWLKASGQSYSEFTSSSRASRAKAPATVVRQPVNDLDGNRWRTAIAAGEKELSDNRVAVITVAGGQGTRLGFDHPKGLFPIGPVTNRSLFQIFAEQILARRNRHACEIPWFVMTSDATHDETVTFFRSQNFFGLPENSVCFFQQGSLPAIDAATGRILLSGPSELALSPDGHGGLVTALDRAGCLDEMTGRGIRHLFYHQVDNPTVIMVDPAFIGFHVIEQSQLSTNVVRKTSPTERMGVLVDMDGRTEIIEYSELTAEQAAKTDESGEWIFWAGNTAIHLFDLEFMKRLASNGCQLPLHAARKSVATIHTDGSPMNPGTGSEPNAIKMERFIFDALPLAEKTLIVEGNRSREFNPVKNRSGADSPETSRAALNRIAHEWLAASRVTVDASTVFEISPLQALDAEELASKFAAGTLAQQDLISKS